MKIGLIGAGIMGAPMAVNLARAGFEVVAWNRTASKVVALASQGVGVAETAADAAAGADFLIVMVHDGPAVDEVLFERGVAQALTPGSTVIVMSSIPVETSRRQAQRLSALGIDYIDAPVSGGERGAVEARLVIMAGGDPASVARAGPVLSRLGAVTHVGPTGAGQLAKLANQVIVGDTIAAVAEALLLVEAGGGDPAAVRAALMGGFAGSRILEEHGMRMVESDFRPGAHAKTQLKDLSTALALADACGLALPTTALVRSQYEELCEGEGAELDHSVLYLKLAGRI